MNNITFTGINNLYIGRTILKPKNLNPEKTIIKIACDLSDDAQGEDLSFFKKQLQKSGSYFQENCIDPESPTKIDFRLATCGPVNKPDVQLLLNNCFVDLDVDKRVVLPLYTFFAKLTNKIINTQSLSKAQLECVETVNKTVHNQAVKFIDNI